jgi:flagellar motor switch protein FliN/FliY
MSDMTQNQPGVDQQPGIGNPGSAQATLRERQPVTMDSLQVAQSGRNMPATINREVPPIEIMNDVPLTLTFEVGRTSITIKQLMELCEGSFVELRHVSVDTIDVRISEQIIAVGEAIALQQLYGIRMGEVEIPPGLDLEKL